MAGGNTRHKLCDLCFESRNREYTPAVADYVLPGGREVSVCRKHQLTGNEAKLSRAEPDFAPAPSVASHTSELAARSVDNSVAAQCRTILSAIRNAGSRGLVREEVCTATGVSNQAACARLNELQKRGAVKASSSWTRKASTGRGQQIYVINQTSARAA